MKLAHPETQDGEFDIPLLIGADHYLRIVQNHVVRGNGPTAVKSKMGYLLSGPLPGDSKRTQLTMLNVFTSPSEVDDLEQLRKLESPGILHNKKDTTNAKKVTTYQRISITRSDGKYSVQLPWKLEHPYLPAHLSYKLTNPTDHEPLTSIHLLHGQRVTTLQYQTCPPDANLVANAINSDCSTLIK